MGSNTNRPEYPERRTGYPVVFSWNNVFRSAERANNGQIREGVALADRFVVERIWRKNDDCVLHVAVDLIERKQVLVKSLSGSNRKRRGLNAKLYGWGKAAATVRHAAFVPIIGAGWYGDHAYVVMERASGVRLSTLLRNRSQRNEEFLERDVTRIACQLCDVAQILLRQKIPFRISPDDILLADSGEIKVLGGAISSLKQTTRSSKSESERQDDTKLEQVVWDEISAQYVIASLMYQLLFRVAGKADSVPAHVLDPIISFSLSQTIGRGLANRASRFPRLEDFRKRINRRGLPAWGRLLAIIASMVALVAVAVTCYHLLVR